MRKVLADVQDGSMPSADDKTAVMTRIAPGGIAWVDSLTSRRVSRARVLVEALKFAADHKTEFEARIKKLEGF